MSRNSVRSEARAKGEAASRARTAPGRNVTLDAILDGPAPRRERLRVRMYRQGLGDCFLITYAPGTPRAAHILIDIGTLGNRKDGPDLDDVVADIVQETGKELAAVVVTHEHSDHISGFPRLERAGVKAKEVWLAWTESKSDPLARKIAKYRGDLFAVALQAAEALDQGSRTGALGALQQGVREVMRFNGYDGEGTLAADAQGRDGLKVRLEKLMRTACSIGGERVFLSPGDVIERPWARGVRFYVLGPPRDAAAIQNPGRHGSSDLYELAFVTKAEVPSAKDSAVDNEMNDSWLPFDHEFMVETDRPSALGDVGKAYDSEPWRKIDDESLAAAAELALQLDDATNNTSLVLAIEIGGEVLLFPGDAQLGSWLTWPNVRFQVTVDGEDRSVTGRDLLRRTTFYKVGHHASHNATATETGLELMGERGLTAFIPLDEGVARRKDWPMPARKLYARLQEKTRGRVFQSDKAEPAPGVTVTDLYVETTIPRAAAGPTVRVRAHDEATEGAG